LRLQLPSKPNNDESKGVLSIQVFRRRLGQILPISGSDIVVVETRNANMNAPMLSINERMGFRVHKREMFMEYPIEELLGKLADYE